MILPFHHPSWETMNIFVSFDQNREPMMAIEDCSVGPDLQRARLTGKQ
jgi:hypothetical protein